MRLNFLFLNLIVRLFAFGLLFTITGAVINNTPKIIPQVSSNNIHIHLGIYYSPTEVPQILETMQILM